jgi:hypothetical protein
MLLSCKNKTIQIKLILSTASMRIRPSARQKLTAKFDFAAKRKAENNRGRLKNKRSDGLG